MTANKKADGYIEPLGLREGPQPAALVDEADEADEADETPVVLRVTVGYTFDVRGTLDLHESGNVTMHPVDPKWEDTLRSGYHMCWDLDESRSPADILRELPTHWRSYLWAAVAFDHTGDTGDTTTAKTEHKTEQ